MASIKALEREMYSLYSVPRLRGLGLKVGDTAIAETAANVNCNVGGTWYPETPVDCKAINSTGRRSAIWAGEYYRGTPPTGYSQVRCFRNEAWDGNKCVPICSEGAIVRIDDKRRLYCEGEPEPVPCGTHVTEPECPANCYWYDGICHASPKEEKTTLAKMLPYGIGIMILGAAVWYFTRPKKPKKK